VEKKMNILEYQNLDTSKVKSQYQKIINLLKNDNLYSAEVKKLNPTNYYRAKLDHTNRLLFKTVVYKNEKYALMLEIISQHAYDKSKFLNGAKIQESKIIETCDSVPGDMIIYFNQNKPNFHILDKIISFDDHQEEAYQLPLPLVIIGPAGSGKTALTLEKMKQCRGDVLYITHSPYLVHNSRELYYANHYDTDHQTIDFLSYHEFIETIQVPQGREINFKDFRRWVNKFSQIKVARDHHKLYEEFKGVISGAETKKPYLSSNEYLNLGVKQSIYLQDEKESVFSMYDKYLQFIKKEGLYDTNLISHEYLTKVKPKYDFIVIDEIQDFTNIQLLLILKSIKEENQFILCGDSNQIVHPNFFSWAKIKSLFYKGEIKTTHNATRILHTNYRSSNKVVQLANSILKIKNIRLGSVDKESNYLMNCNSSTKGEVHFLKLSDTNVQTLNEKTKRSTKYAVIVIRDDYKEAAKKKFNTPLIFSIHEAKGLEYENVILYDFIASESKAFLEIAHNVSKEDLLKDLVYLRGRNKSDRSLEIYKFYINALYVAVTRSIKNVYWVESLKKHPLLDLLGIKELQNTLNIDMSESSLDEWQSEARKLELQGKQDQADAIRSQLIKEKPVPWEVLTVDKVKQLEQNVLHVGAAKKSQILLLEYALVYQQFSIVKLLEQQGVQAARNPQKSIDLINRKYYDTYSSKNIKMAMQYTENYGVNFRNIFNQTVLMVSVHIGNKTLAKALLDSGANINLTDNIGENAFQISLRRAMFDKNYTEKCLSNFYHLLSPNSLSIQADEKLIKIDKRSMEYFIFYAADVLRKMKESKHNTVFTAGDFVNYLQHFPADVLPDFRKKQQYISSILSKNEVSREGLYNRKIFKRIKRGYYIINPELKIKINEQWVPHS
jgi:hypothetical protein